MTELEQSLWKIMRQEQKEVPPVMIYVNGEYKFNGVNYGRNENAANAERRNYFNQLNKQS